MAKKQHKKTPRKALPRKLWWGIGSVVTLVYIAIFYYFFVGPTGFRWRALYGDAQYPEGYEIQGIDISHYQGNIDWAKLQGAIINKCPVRFVIVKSTEGRSLVDENFRHANMVSYAEPTISGALNQVPAIRPISFLTR